MDTFADESATTIPARLRRDRDFLGADQSHEGLLERIRSVAPVIATKSAEAESLRHPHDDVVAALEATGVFKSFVPQEYGGYEIDPHEFIDIGLEVAQACCATGWLTTFYMEHNWIVAASLGVEAVDEIFSAQPYVLAPGAVNPMGGVANPVDGGFELSGRWHFNSGIVHGDWVILTALEHTEKAPILRVYLLPREDVRVEDTWDVGGMRGTGSHDVVVDGVFVPERFASPMPPPKRRSTAHEHYDMYRLPAFGLLPLAAAIPMVGGAKRALTIFQDRLSTRVQLMSTKAQQDKPAAQLRLANVAMQVAKSERTLRSVADLMLRITQRPDPASGLESAELQFMVADAARDARSAIFSILEASGAHAHFGGSELQRIYRDVLTGSGHIVFDVDAKAQDYGRALVKSYSEAP